MLQSLPALQEVVDVLGQFGMTGPKRAAIDGLAAVEAGEERGDDLVKELAPVRHVRHGSPATPGLRVARGGD